MPDASGPVGGKGRALLRVFVALAVVYGVAAHLGVAAALQERLAEQHYGAVAAQLGSAVAALGTLLLAAVIAIRVPGDPAARSLSVALAAGGLSLWGSPPDWLTPIPTAVFPPIALAAFARFMVLFPRTLHEDDLRWAAQGAGAERPIEEGDPRLPPVTRALSRRMPRGPRPLIRERRLGDAIGLLRLLRSPWLYGSSSAVGLIFAASLTRVASGWLPVAEKQTES